MKREKAAIKKFKIAIDAKDLTDFQKIVICFEKKQTIRGYFRKSFRCWNNNPWLLRCSYPI